MNISDYKINNHNDSNNKLCCEVAASLDYNIVNMEQSLHSFWLESVKTFFKIDWNVLQKVVVVSSSEFSIFGIGSKSKSRKRKRRKKIFDVSEFSTWPEASTYSCQVIPRHGFISIHAFIIMSVKIVCLLFRFSATEAS